MMADSLVRRAAVPVLVPVADVGLAWLALRLVDEAELAGSVLAYAMALLPLAALTSAASGRLAGRKRPVGAIAAVVAALLAAQFLAMIRFYQAGARGFLSLAAAPYTSEVLMVLGALPLVGWVGASVAGARWDRGMGSAIGLAGGAGALLAPLVGVGLVVTRLVATFPLLDPVVQWILIVTVLALGGKRGARPS